ncbi:MAG: hypothetical protein KatS3mg082_2007 [Nitrospiraceae bacterium]|nr:MAG: hypothetical protein KatS3mg082_2007 [Nitrospiraceae bacterium]
MSVSNLHSNVIADTRTQEFVDRSLVDETRLWPNPLHHLPRRPPHPPPLPAGTESGVGS